MKEHDRQPLVSPIITFTKLDNDKVYNLELLRPVKWQGNLLFFKTVIGDSYKYGSLGFWDLETQTEHFMIASLMLVI